MFNHIGQGPRTMIIMESGNNNGVNVTGPRGQGRGRGGGRHNNNEMKIKVMITMESRKSQKSLLNLVLLDVLGQ